MRRFLPYYSRGNLQDAMTQTSITGNKLPERRLLELFHGTCLASVSLLSLSQLPRSMRDVYPASTPTSRHSATS